MDVRSKATRSLARPMGFSSKRYKTFRTETFSVRGLCRGGAFPRAHGSREPRGAGERSAVAPRSRGRG